ncbi:MAG: hypothetical protein K2L82_02360 [Lachnospiraceae bacterium]|nr:hypothetical protein [Lachnospiraceae bacterium]
MNRKLKISGRDIFGYLLLGLSVIMLGKSLLLCFSSDIWYDELFTVGMIEHSYGDLIAFTARDVHPPLYYCIVKLVVDLCKLISAQTNPVIVAKMVSVFPYFILFAYSVTFIRKRFGIFAGGLFLFCVTTMPQLSAYTVEVRMYSFALLFVTAAFLHGYGTITAGSGVEEKRREGSRKPISYPPVRMRRVHAAALIFYGLAAAYTQYFACVAVIMVYLYVLAVFIIKDRQRIKEWFLWVAISIVGYAPWLYALVNQITAVNDNYWILPLTWRSLGGCVKFVMKPAFTNEVLSTILAVILFIVYAAAFGYEVIKLYHYGRQNEKNAINNGIFIAAGTGVLAGVVMFGFIASKIIRPIFVYRYMIPALGCFWLSFAVGLHDIWMDTDLCKPEDARNNTDEQDTVVEHTLRKSTKEKISQAVVIIISSFVIVIGLRDYRAFMGEEEYKVLLMEQTTEALSSIAPEDIVIYNFDQVQAVTSYYLDRRIESYLWCGTPETLIQEIIRPYDTVEETQTIKEWCESGRNVWFIGSFNSREDIVKEWASEGIRIEETGSYLLERYWFNLYKASVERQ